MFPFSTQFATIWSKLNVLIHTFWNSKSLFLLKEESQNCHNICKHLQHWKRPTGRLILLWLLLAWPTRWQTDSHPPNKHAIVHCIYICTYIFLPPPSYSFFISAPLPLATGCDSWRYFFFLLTAATVAANSERGKLLSATTHSGVFGTWLRETENQETKNLQRWKAKKEKLLTSFGTFLWM